jgi:hypothetical protein
VEQLGYGLSLGSFIEKAAKQSSRARPEATCAYHAPSGAFRSADVVRANSVCIAALTVTLATPRVAVAEEVPAETLLERPGLYAAFAGAVLLSLGLQFGAAASSVGPRMRDANRDGLIDGVTRAEVLAAQRYAVLSNVVGAAGVLGLGIGVGWLILDYRESNATPGLRLVVRGAF